MADPSFHSPVDYLDLARSPDASPSQLRDLAQSTYVFVRLAVGRHPATPTEVLHSLVPRDVEDWNDQDMLLALASNPSSPVEVLRGVADLVPVVLHVRNGQRGFAAGVELFKRDDTPDEVLLGLIDHPDVTTEFRKVAARETHRESALSRLRVDRSETVRRTARREDA